MSTKTQKTNVIFFGGCVLYVGKGVVYSLCVVHTAQSCAIQNFKLL